MSGPAFPLPTVFIATDRLASEAHHAQPALPNLRTGADRLTVLESWEGLAAKTYERAPGGDGWVRTAAPNCTHWRVHTHLLRSLDDAYELLADLKLQPRSLVVRGTPREGADLLRLRRTGTQHGGNFLDQPLHLLCFDFDDLDAPEAWQGVHAPGAAQLAYQTVLPKLPRCFQRASCLLEFSASQDIEKDEHGLFHHTVGTKLKIHVWFWLDQAVDSATLRRWVRVRVPEADPALFQQVQPHYTAAPVFPDGADPLRGHRLFRIEGEPSVPFGDELAALRAREDAEAREKALARLQAQERAQHLKKRLTEERADQETHLALERCFRYAEAAVHRATNLLSQLSGTLRYQQLLGQGCALHGLCLDHRSGLSWPVVRTELEAAGTGASGLRRALEYADQHPDDRQADLDKVELQALSWSEEQRLRRNRRLRTRVFEPLLPLPQLLAQLKQSIQKATQSPGKATLISAPPGTAKTTTSVQVATQRVQEGQLVLWAAPDRQSAVAVTQLFEQQGIWVEPWLGKHGVPLPPGAPWKDLGLVVDPDGRGRATTCVDADMLNASSQGRAHPGRCRVCPHRGTCNGQKGALIDPQAPVGYAGMARRSGELVDAGKGGVIVTTHALHGLLIEKLKQDFQVEPDLILIDESPSLQRCALARADVEELLLAAKRLQLQAKDPSEVADLTPLVDLLEATLRAFAERGTEEMARAAEEARRKDKPTPQVVRYGYREEGAVLVALAEVADQVLDTVAKLARRGDVPFATYTVIEALAKEPKRAGLFLPGTSAGLGARAPHIWAHAPPPDYPAQAAVMFLDATGQPYRLAAYARRDLKAVKLRLKPHQQMRAVMSNTTAWQPGRLQYAKPEEVHKRLAREWKALRADVRRTYKDRVAGGEERPVALLIASRMTLRMHAVGWAWFAEQFRAEGFEVRVIHWRGTDDRATNLYTGAAVVAGFGSPRVNVGAFEEEERAFALWAGLDPDDPATWKDEEDPELDVRRGRNEENAQGQATQGHGRPRDATDPKEKAALHISLAPAGSHPDLVVDLVKRGQGYELDASAIESSAVVQRLIEAWRASDLQAWSAREVLKLARAGLFGEFEELPPERTLRRHTPPEALAWGRHEVATGGRPTEWRAASEEALQVALDAVATLAGGGRRTASGMGGENTGGTLFSTPLSKTFSEGGDEKLEVLPSWEDRSVFEAPARSAQASSGRRSEAIAPPLGVGEALSEELKPPD